MAAVPVFRCLWEYENQNLINAMKYNMEASDSLSFSLHCRAGNNLYMYGLPENEKTVLDKHYRERWERFCPPC